MGKPVASLMPYAENTRRKQWFTTLYNQRYLFLMSVPFIIWLVIFSYVPIWGWIMAFQNYIPGLSFGEQEWVGLKYFGQLFADPRFYVVLKNTFIMAVLQVVLSGFVFPILFALFLNEVFHIKFKRLIQTVSYLPHFVSWVVVASIFMQMLSPESGIINNVLTSLNLVEKPVHFMAKPEYFYWLVTIIDIWKEMGWNAIIFLAAISGIDPELYEAATVDGAGRWRRIWHITLPGIRSTTIVLVIMSVGHMMQMGIDKQLLLGNPLVIDRAEVLGIYALNYGLYMQRFGFGTAVGIFQSVVSITLLLTTNFISKKMTNEGLI